MKRFTDPRTGWPAGLFAACSILFTSPLAEAEGDQWRHDAPPPEIAALELPEGRLAGVGGSPGRMVFVALDETRRRGDVVDIDTYWVIDPGVPYGDGNGTQAIVPEAIDCAARTERQLGQKIFNDHDTFIHWSPAHPTSEPISDTSLEVYIEKLVCAASIEPQGKVYVGHHDAMAVGKSTLRALAQIGVGQFFMQDRHRHGPPVKLPPR